MIFSIGGKSIFFKATFVATPSALAAVGLKILQERSAWVAVESENILFNSSAYTGFMFVLGFLMVFRTSQGYTRFWEGAHAMFQMRQKLCDAVSSLVAFAQQSKKHSDEIEAFQHLLVRLMSLLHAMACVHIAEVSELKFEVIDIHGLDQESMVYLERIPRHVRTEVVVQWIHRLVVENVETGLLPVPPPILTRVFSELSSAMSAFATASKISAISFPPACAKLQVLLLIMHWFLTPVVVVLWTGHPFSTFVFVFAPVFSLWCMHFVASEIEQPFGVDANDLGVHESQQQLNEFLVLLLAPRTNRTPRLMENAIREIHLLTAETESALSGRSFDASTSHLVEKVYHHPGTELHITEASSICSSVDLEQGTDESPIHIVVHPLRRIKSVNVNERSKAVLAHVHHATGKANHVAFQREKSEGRSENRRSSRSQPADGKQGSIDAARAPIEPGVPPEGDGARPPPLSYPAACFVNGSIDGGSVARVDVSLGGIVSSMSED